jgi:hypothetical protein
MVTEPTAADMVERSLERKRKAATAENALTRGQMNRRATLDDLLSAAGGR